MKKLFASLFISLALFSCKDSDNKCLGTSEFHQSINAILKQLHLSKSTVEISCITDLHDHFQRDSTKVAVRATIKTSEGDLILEEYQFDPKYLEDLAMEVTYIEFISIRKKGWAFHRVVELRQGTCLIAQMQKPSEKTIQIIEQNLTNYERTSP